MIFYRYLDDAFLCCDVACVFFCIYRRRNRRFPCNRESILLRQKTAAEYDCKTTSVPHQQLQPVTALPPEAVHLTSDTTDLLHKGQSVSANSTPRCHHHHIHNVKINGNDYEHIWESTIPYPSGNSGTLKADLSTKAKHNREPSYTTFKIDNRQKDSVRPMYVTSMDLFTGRAKVKETSPYETCRYSTLEKARGLTKHNSCSRHQDLLL